MSKYNTTVVSNPDTKIKELISDFFSVESLPDVCKNISSAMQEVRSNDNLTPQYKEDLLWSLSRISIFLIELKEG